MKFKPVKTEDLPQLKALQPEGWPDIIPQFEFYVQSTYCYPFKYILGNQIVGLGTYILFEKTAWLAHIIVDINQRKKGIGLQIVEQLLDKIQKHSIKTCLLIATELGQSVYDRAGFRTICDYAFLEREKPWKQMPYSENIFPFQEQYTKKVFSMDKEVTGENRENLLTEHLENCQLYIENNEVLGYYLPALREGPIIAQSEIAGMELMKLKYATINQAVLPAENEIGIQLLKEYGFTEVNKTGKRMILGEEVHWEAQKIYSRIGGNFG